jgi:hypothetical protein
MTSIIHLIYQISPLYKYFHNKITSKNDKFSIHLHNTLVYYNNSKKSDMPPEKRIIDITKLSNNLYPYIVENYGKFDNAGLVLKHIIDVLKNNFKSQKIDCKEYNVYFDYLDIEIDESSNSYAGYDSYKDKIVKIVLHGSEEYFNDNIDKYIKLILHELLHGYEDYNRIKNTGKSIYDYWNEKYANSFKSLNSLNDVKAWLSRANYFLNSQERNAYLSELEYDIKKIFKDDHITIETFNYSKFKQKLKESDMWKNYFDISIFILKLYNTNWNNNQKEYVEELWANTYKEQKTFNQIKKELYNKWQKFEKKFEQLVPKLICQYIETNLKEVSFDISLLNEDNYWKNII